MKKKSGVYAKIRLEAQVTSANAHHIIKKPPLRIDEWTRKSVVGEKIIEWLAHNGFLHPLKSVLHLAKIDLKRFNLHEDFEPKIIKENGKAKVVFTEKEGDNGRTN